MLFELMALKRPFVGENTFNVMHNIIFNKVGDSSQHAIANLTIDADDTSSPITATDLSLNRAPLLTELSAIKPVYKTFIVLLKINVMLTRSGLQSLLRDTRLTLPKSARPSCKLNQINGKKGASLGSNFISVCIFVLLWLSDIFLITISTFSLDGTGVVTE